MPKNQKYKVSKIWNETNEVYNDAQKLQKIKIKTRWEHNWPKTERIAIIEDYEFTVHYVSNRPIADYVLIEAVIHQMPKDMIAYLKPVPIITPSATEGTENWDITCAATPMIFRKMQEGDVYGTYKFQSWFWITNLDYGEDEGYFPCTLDLYLYFINPNKGHSIQKKKI